MIRILRMGSELRPCARALRTFGWNWRARREGCLKTWAPYAGAQLRIRPTGSSGSVPSAEISSRLAMRLRGWKKPVARKRHLPCSAIPLSSVRAGFNWIQSTAALGRSAPAHIRNGRSSMVWSAGICCITRRSGLWSAEFASIARVSNCRPAVLTLFSARRWRTGGNGPLCRSSCGRRRGMFANDCG